MCAAGGQEKQGLALSSSMYNIHLKGVEKTSKKLTKSIQNGRLGGSGNAFGGVLGCLKAPLGRVLVCQGHLGSIGCLFGAACEILGTSSGILEAFRDIFAVSWSILGESWEYLGVSWRSLGHVLGVFLDILREFFIDV